MKRRTVYHLAALAALVYLYGWCQYRRGEGDALLHQAGRQTDSAAAVTDRRVAELARREVQRESTLARTGRDLSNARREIVQLRGRVAPVDTSLPAVVVEQFAVRDSIIAAQETVIAAQAEQLTLWKALAVERGALLRDALQQRDQYRDQRDAWQKKSARRFTCGVGPGLTVSLGGRSLGGATIACVIRIG